MNQADNYQKKIVERIKANDPLALKQLYHTNYFKVEQYVLKNSGTKEQAKDIYQEAFIVLWKNIKLEKFIPKGDTALNGYLYSIARNKWLDHLKSAYHRKHNHGGNNEAHLVNAEALSENEPEARTDLLNQTLQNLRQLGEPCKSLLMAFYFHKKSLREIAQEQEIGEASARNKKYRCIEKLRASIHNTT